MGNLTEGRLAELPRTRLEDPPSLASVQPQWPVLKGQVIIVFTSRSGSTYLCRHIEKTRAVSGVAEAFNEPQLRSIQQRYQLASLEDALARRMVRGSEQGWFVAKAGVPGLTLAEQLGHIDRYIGVTKFLFLIRKNALAQAVSNGTAKTSGQFHSTQSTGRPVDADDYDEVVLLKSLRNVVVGNEILLRYIGHMEDRPKAIFYEDFEHGDFSAIDAYLTEIGLPERIDAPANPPGDVHRLKHDVTNAWIERLRKNPEAQPFLDRHDRLIAAATARFG